MRARFFVVAAALAAGVVSGDPARAQPQRGGDPQVTIAAVRSYFEQELPIGWRVREVQIAQDGRGANVYLDAPFWTIGDMNAQAHDVCPGTEAFLWRSVLFVAISVSRRGFGGTGAARCSAMGGRQ
jgi:hypothetical protein